MSLVVWMRGRKVALWLGAAALLGSATASHGQTSACTPETAGQLSVQAGVRCQCVRVPEGGITGTPAGHAWDCGVLRGRRNQLVPATPDAHPMPLVDVLVLDPDRASRAGKRTR